MTEYIRYEHNLGGLNMNSHRAIEDMTRGNRKDSASIPHSGNSAISLDNGNGTANTKTDRPVAPAKGRKTIYDIWRRFSSGK